MNEQACLKSRVMLVILVILVKHNIIHIISILIITFFKLRLRAHKLQLQ